MIGFSIASVFMAILTSNLLLLLLYFVLRNKTLMINIGNKLLFVVIGLIVIRLMTPIELPITTNIYLTETLSFVFAVIRRSWLEDYGCDITIWNIFEVIWFIGIIINGYKFSKSYRAFHSIILKHGEDVSREERYTAILNQICEAMGKKNNFFVVKIPGIYSPVVFGFKKKYILIPEAMDFNQEELYFILSHETAHFFNHDLLLKLFIQVLTIIYWWNPFSYLLKQQISVLLEMRVDQNILHSKEHTKKTAYLNCLLKVARQSSNVLITDVLISFSGCNKSVLSKRFNMVLGERKKIKSSFLSVLVFIPTILLYLFSVLFIFENDYVFPDLLAGTFELTKENSYLVEIGDGIYELYYIDEYLETTDTLEYYPSDLIIYEGGMKNELK